MSSPFFCVYHHLFYLHRHLFLPTSSPFLPRASPCVYVYHHLCFTFALAPLNHLYFTFLIQLADPHEYNTRLSQLLYICIYISIYTHAYVHTYIYIYVYIHIRRGRREERLYGQVTPVYNVQHVAELDRHIELRLCLRL